MQIKTPGVYVQEISTLPPSVAQVATAIPAFIGYTEKNFPTNSTPVIKRITSLKEYEKFFGLSGDSLSISSKVTPIAASGGIPAHNEYDLGDGNPSNVTPTLIPAISKMYYSLQHFYANGGGTCYIVSVGQNVPVADTVNLVPTEAQKSALRTAITTSITSLLVEDEPTLIVMPDAAETIGADKNHDAYTTALSHCALMQDRFAILDVPSNGSVVVDKTDFHTKIGVNNLSYGASYYPYLETSLTRVISQNKIELNDNGAITYLSDVAENDTVSSALLGRIQSFLAVEAEKIILPPSGSIAGVYAAVDNARGVWKAPANVSLNGVVKPTKNITMDDQDELNVPANGKAINAIRTFTGKGTLVWGARTLDGNSREWKYVNVRRLYINVEESLQKALEPFVFEANDANTWAKIRGLASSFLTTLWKQGGLVGPTVSDAFFVKVGLGETMSPTDVLDGIMNIEIGLAASRPAEFIVLKFSHKVQGA